MAALLIRGDDLPRGYVACDLASRQKINLNGKSELSSFPSPNGTYHGRGTVILSPEQVLTISRNEPKIGQISRYSKGSLWLTDSHQRSGQHSKYMGPGTT